MPAGPDTGTPATSLQETVHATTLAHSGSAVLIQGASGTGKSTLALQLISLGAQLVADDRTDLTVLDGTLIADAPDTIRGQIEARGVGILSTPAAGPTPVALVIDMDQIETERLPPRRDIVLSGITLPLLRQVDARSFPAAIMIYLTNGRIA